MTDAPRTDSLLADSRLGDSPLADSRLADSPLADSSLAGIPLGASPLVDSSLADSRLADAPLVAVVGAGIGGLATCWHLQREAVMAGLPLRIVLAEGSGRTGGKLLSERHETDAGEFLVEGGPDCFLRSQKPWGTQLAVELGMQDRLLGTNEAKEAVSVLRDGHPIPLPEGLLLLVPTELRPFALSPLVSWRGKLRMGMDLVIPGRTDDGDETMADFVRRRLGAEALDRIAEPLLSGIHNAEADRQSIMATFPRFRELEKRHGSLIRGMLSARNAARRARAQSAGGEAKGLSGERGEAAAPALAGSTFVTFRDGVQELTDTLRRDINVQIEHGVRVLAVEHPDWPKPVRLTGVKDGFPWSLDVDAAVLATPAYEAASMLRATAPVAAGLLEQIRYVDTGVASFGFRQGDVEKAPRGFGIVIPRSERRPINAVTFSSSKFAHRAPAEHALLRVFFGGSRSPQSMELDDDELIRTVRGELAAIGGIVAAPILTTIHRWPRANPQYDVGHLERVDQLEAALPEDVFVTGSAYRGVGVPDCVHAAELIARRVLASLPAAKSFIGAAED